MTHQNLIKKLVASTGAAAVLAGGSLVAGDYGKAVIDDKMPIESAWTICDIFDMNTLYEGEGLVQKVKLTGRYHGQMVSQSETIGAAQNGFHEWQHRRFRLGGDIEFANNITLSASANISDGSAQGPLTNGVFFDDWDELFIEWEPSDDFYVKVGKQKQKITRENATSSKRILTIERSHIVNETISNKPWGVTVGFNMLGLDHEVGGWVYGTQRDATGERWDLMDDRSRGGFTYRTSYGITEATDLHLDYQFTNTSGGAAAAGGRADNNLGSAYEHVVALGTESEFGRLGLITDIIFGANRTGTGLINAGEDTHGFVVMPYYDITDKLQFVTRWAYMSDGRQQRTQRYNVRSLVDNYHTFYAGLNYYICEHNLKLMAGYEYATGDQMGTGANIDSSTWMFGIRTYF